MPGDFGGKVTEGDTSPLRIAIREASEESNRKFNESLLRANIEES